MSFVSIALGSNLGDRWTNLSAAVNRLRAEPGVRVLKVSSFYETSPVNCSPCCELFLNAAMVLETDRLPADLLHLLLGIERQLGRNRTGFNSPRSIDLDLLLYDDWIINENDLTIPHPRMHERAFVLVPLAEIASQAIHPTSRKNVAALLATIHSDDRSGVRLFSKLTDSPGTLKGLRALVTGSTSGIGHAMALAFARSGAEVCIHGRDVSKIESTILSCRDLNPIAGSHVRGYRADLGIPAEVDRLAAEAWLDSEGLDVVVCNAGADVLTGIAAKLSFDEKLDSLVNVDLKATMRLARDLGARMQERGRGSIITIGWDQAESGMEGDSGQLFAAIKGAVTCFTRSLSLSLAPEVRVNCIAPGWIRTSWGDTASATWQERIRDETPLGVWGLPEDVAETAVWLAGPMARFITGQTICVNGGAIR